ncbi:MAG TPA: EAL domain-containing protein, partial [Accumulibacter sp.]|nr:EAL domain-containing protein [Accumulibacter sp.]
MQTGTQEGTLLIVDDQPVNRLILEELLRSRYRVISAASGPQALTLATQEPVPELILLDIMMPEMDGYAVLAALQSQPATRDIPVLFLTALSDPAKHAHGLSLGAVDYIVKPIQPAVVLARVHTHLELKRARDLLRDHNAWLEAEVARRVEENRRLDDANRQEQARLNHRLELILRTAGEGIYGIDLNGRINFVNPAVVDMLGYPREELLGRSAHATFHHSNPDGSPNPFSDCPLMISLTAGVSLRDRCDVFWRRDGLPLIVEYSSAPIIEQGQVVGAMVSVRDISERQRYLEQLERQSNFDDLTGLPNRNLLADRLAQAIGLPRQETPWLAVLAIKTDRLESVRGTLGREATDQVIVELARRLAAQMPPTDTLARLEGDEFVLLSELARAELAGARAQSMIDAWTPPVGIGEHELTLGASVGIALFPKDGDKGQELLRHAFSALHRARADGGGLSRYYAADIDAQAIERLDLERELRRAIANEQLILRYQPQVSLRSGLVVGVEALIRWLHPTRGELPAAAFMALAEESGLIHPLVDWTLRAACAQNRAWRRAGLRPVRMAINFAARQCLGQDFVDSVAAATRANGPDPHGLEIELTERTVMADPDAFVRISRQLRQLAVSLAIDDFGTGFSSLNHLRHFAIDRLKIDRSFICDINRDPDGASIVQGVIALAHNLRLSVVAEGVETEAQLAFLRSRDCDDMQGKLFSEPLTAVEFAQLLISGRKVEFPSAPTTLRTLLLVDDEVHILSSLRRLFRREGYQILTASGAAEALDLLATRPAQVIISDARMPGMDGSELLAKVRKLYPETVRLMLSGYTDMGAVTRAVNSGELYRFITKPWDD